MDIIQRNFLRLLKSGAFGQREKIEPMSPWKWNRLYQLSQMHDVTPWAYDGIKMCSDDFFLRIRPSQLQVWQQSVAEADKEIAKEDEQHLTNPLLNHKLQQLIEQEHDSPTLELLLNIIRLARFILTQGINMRHLVELGIYLRTTKDQIDYQQLSEWIKRLRMRKIVKLEAALLVHFFDFKPEEIPFTEATISKATIRVADDILKTSSEQAAEWYFTQGKNVFVSTTNSGAMMWHVRHSAKYMGYYPSEAVTNFLANFAHSLSHIEE
ncbi:MAG: hypothetical protein IJ633_02075 [Prevotella sp.]|nr:hypothetical protein [Prevotella sp.]